MILISRIRNLITELVDIQAELLPAFVKPIPVAPEIDVETEFPERALKV